MALAWRIGISQEIKRISSRHNVRAFRCPPKSQTRDKRNLSLLGVVNLNTFGPSWRLAKSGETPEGIEKPDGGFE